MPKINVYLSDPLAEAVRNTGLPVSSVCQQALAEAVAVAEAAAADASGGRGASVESPRFTAKAQAAVAEACRAADADGRAPTPRDLVSAMLAAGDNLATRVLQAIEIDPEELLVEVRGLGHLHLVRSCNVGLDAVLRAAAAHAVDLGHNVVGCEHLLLAVAADPGDPAAAALARHGADYASLRRAMIVALVGYGYARENLTLARLPAPVQTVLEEIRARLARLETRGSGRSPRSERL